MKGPQVFLGRPRVCDIKKIGKQNLSLIEDSVDFCWNAFVTKDRKMLTSNIITSDTLPRRTPTKKYNISRPGTYNVALFDYSYISFCCSPVCRLKYDTYKHTYKVVLWTNWTYRTHLPKSSVFLFQTQNLRTKEKGEILVPLKFREWGGPA